MTNPAASTAEPRPSLSAAGRATYEAFIRVAGLFSAIIIVAAIFIAINPNIGNVYMAGSVLRSMSSMTIMALGVLLVIVVGEVDLSFAAIYGLAANAFGVLWINFGLPVYLAILIGLAVGAAAGFFNSVMVTRLKIPSFITTLGTYNLFYGFTLWLSNSQTFNPVYAPPAREMPKTELDFFTGLTQSVGSAGFSLEIAWMIGIAIVVYIILHRTLFGFRLFAIGGNPTAANLARLPVTRLKTLAFVLGGLLAGLAGILDFSFIQTVQPDSGLTQTFPVFAAVVIGGASLSGGKGTVIGTIGGALLLAELQLGLSILTPGPHVQQIFLGVVTVGAVALDLILTNMRKRRSV
jgi:ribose/xylose/arabinose/galactoside ABC-type transport system permease subunit